MVRMDTTKTAKKQKWNKVNTVVAPTIFQCWDLLLPIHFENIGKMALLRIQYNRKMAISRLWAFQVPLLRFVKYIFLENFCTGGPLTTRMRSTRIPNTRIGKVMNFCLLRGFIPPTTRLSLDLTLFYLGGKYDPTLRFFWKIYLKNFLIGLKFSENS